MLVCAALLAVMTFTDLITPALLLALTFALGVGAALMSPAWQAIQPDLVPPEEFGQAVALSSLTFNVGRAIGPALGGALVASAGAGWAFVVNAASFLGVLCVLLWWRPEHSVGPPVDGVAARRASMPASATASTHPPCGRCSCGPSPSWDRLPPSRRCCRRSCAIASAWAPAATGSCWRASGSARSAAAVLRPRLDSAPVDHLVVVSSVDHRRRTRHHRRVIRPPG